MPVVNLHCAGIDVGSRSHLVAIGQTKEDVREFGVYTDELHELCGWLKTNDIETVALESTGTYWQNLFVLLQDYGLKPILVSGKFTKNVQGRKTDVQDCQWIQKLHSLGLLPNSFLPDSFTEQLRQYSRHRQYLLENAADYIKKMQQSLRRLNLRLDVVIRDVSGQSGQAIIRAIIDGERDGEKLAALANYRCRQSKEEIARALTGDWKQEYILELRHACEIYAFFQAKITECDQAIESCLSERIQEEERQEGVQRPAYGHKKRKQQNKNAPKLDLEKLSFQLSGGVDLSAIDGVSSATILSILAEVGTDLSAFPTAKHFAAWLRLAPNNKVSGGRLISSRTPKNKNRLAQALQRAANVIGNNIKAGALHQFFKRVAYKKGQTVAIVATARKLAVIIWHMLTKKISFNYLTERQYLEEQRHKILRSLERQINKLGIKPEELSFKTT